MQVETTFDDAAPRKYPEPVAIAVAAGPGGRANPISLSWFMQTSIEPPMFAISIGRTRYSLEVVRQARAFVLAYVSETMAADVLYHGRHSGRDGDKLAACGTRTQPARRVPGVILADAVVNYECVLEAEHETGDHVIFVGRVVAVHVNSDPSARRLYCFADWRFAGVVAVND